MEQRQLGESGLWVSELGLGAMTFGAECDEATSHALLDRYVEAGGNLIDTADVYAAGRSEEIIGTWVDRRGGPGELVVATKGRFATGDGPNRQGAGRRHLTRAVDASLRRLRVEVIDLYQLHAWDPDVPVEETAAVMADLVRVGKVRYWGVSNYTGWQLQRMITAGQEWGVPPVSLQLQYNLLGREVEWELVPQCLEEGLGMLAWSPLAGGWLTGKYRRDEPPAGSNRLGEDPRRGIEAYELRNTEHTWQVLEAVREAAGRSGCSMAQVALRWLLDRPGMSSVILGARTIEQLDANLASLEVTLTPEDTQRLTEASAPGLPLYPYGFLEHYAGYDMWEWLGTRREPPMG